jgi:LAO/AO transport system kinase
MPPGSSAASLLAGLRNRDRRLIGRAITEIENDSRVGAELATLLQSGPGQAFTIGLTGPPGAGKSTLVGSLVPLLLERGHRVAVLLIDPSSPLTGGALLGDRIRLSGVAASDALYVRSLGNRGAVGGVTSAIRTVIAAMSVAGFDLVLIETVGAGQSDVSITAIADFTICALPPGLGDSVQALKAGIQEVADMFVVTKGDRPGADQLFRQLRATARRATDSQPRPVIVTSSNDGSGLAAVADELSGRSAPYEGALHGPEAG